jgi:hypothetical protein
LSGARRWFGRLIVALVVVGLAPAAFAELMPTLQGDTWTASPSSLTLFVSAQADGRNVTLSGEQDGLGPVADYASVGENGATWRYPDSGVTVVCRMEGDDLHMNFTADRPGELTWPIVEPGPEARAFILPFNEGSYVPVDHEGWRARLTGGDPIDTTEGLSMPFWGVDYGDFTLTCIATNRFGNEIQFTERDGRLGLRFTHSFGRLWEKKEFGFVIRRGGPSPVEPARQYRQWLIEQGRFVSMAEKIERLPAAAKLLGAAHIYLWGDAPLSRHDVRDWRALAAGLAAGAEGPGARIRSLLDDETRGMLADMSTQRRPQLWAARQVAEAISSLLLRRDFFDAAAWGGIDLAPEAQALAAKDADALNEAEVRQLNMMALEAALPGVFIPHERWGDGFSVKMMDAFAEAGFDRLWLGANSWQAGYNHPQAVARAEELGYLIGPYDSYDSVHDPDAGLDDTWETAQFDRKLYETGAMVRRDGKKRAGFQRKGYRLSPIAAWPYVEKRVRGIFDILPVPFNSWFIDCDAYGDLFDDYSELHTATAEDNMKARLDRMAWIRDTFGLVIGSERGAGFAAPVIHFAHGMMTPVIGWGDPDLQRNRDSQYYLGGWWPPDGPAVFVKQVPLKPDYFTWFYDPAFRLPLYQTVFNDSVIATHHWGYHSLKFTDQIPTVELQELLCDVPPLYHMNLDEFTKHGERMKAHYAFFSPLHRELALLPLTGFEWLTDDRMVQRTVFGDKVEITANFTDAPFEDGGIAVPARSVVAHRLDTGETRTYTPAP